MDSFMDDQDLQPGLVRNTAIKEATGPAAKFVSQGGSQQLDLGQVDSSAQPDADPTGQQHGDEQVEEAPPPLTSTVAIGLQSMEERRQQLHAMIDELAQVGLHFLDQQRHQFLRTLESFKDEVDSFCRDEVGKGQQLSYETIASDERLSRAQLLVQTLGGAVCQPRGLTN